MYSDRPVTLLRAVVTMDDTLYPLGAHPKPEDRVETDLTNHVVRAVGTCPSQHRHREPMKMQRGGRI